MKKLLQREVEVTFSRHAQPVWFRLVKYPEFGAAGYLLWSTGYFWPCFAVLWLATPGGGLPGKMLRGSRRGNRRPGRKV